MEELIVFLSLIFILNFILSKTNNLIDFQTRAVSSHKTFVNLYNKVPISGGIILLLLQYIYMDIRILIFLFSHFSFFYWEFYQMRKF